MSLPFLLEIGTEEIPDWMIVQALNQLQDRVAQVARPSQIRADATPRRLVIRAEGLIEKEPDSEELLLGSAEIGWRRSRCRVREEDGRHGFRAWHGNHGQGRIFQLQKAGERTPHCRRSRRIAPRNYPGHQLAESDVLERQGQLAIHSSHPLADRAARRRRDSVRDRRRALRQLDARSPHPRQKRHSTSPSPITNKNCGTTSSS